MGSSSEQYCLKWNDFHANITGAFSEIRDDEDFLDVTLVANGQTIRAHKLVLSSCSPLFRTMLKKNTHPQPMIFLHGVKYSDVAAILNFMYRGEVNVNQEDLPAFLAAAEELRIRGLSDKSGADTPTTPKRMMRTDKPKNPQGSEELSNSDSIQRAAKRKRLEEDEDHHHQGGKDLDDSGAGGEGDQQRQHQQQQDFHDSYYGNMNLYGGGSGGADMMNEDGSPGGGQTNAQGTKCVPNWGRRRAYL